MKKLLLAFVLFASSFGHAEMFFKDQSVSLLSGDDYEVGDAERYVVTYEHFSAHSWGDVFAFVDRLHDKNNGGRETYSEISPNFVLTSFGDGLVKNIKLATTWELSEASDNLLLGLGSDFSLPGFSNFSVSVYQRFNDSGKDNQQVTIVWGVPFNLAGQDFKFDGFWDYTTEVADTTSSNFTPQLKWDMAKVVGYSNKLYLGIEYVMWSDKFNIAGVDENNVNLLVKAHF